MHPHFSSHKYLVFPILLRVLLAYVVDAAVGGLKHGSQLARIALLLGVAAHIFQQPSLDGRTLIQQGKLVLRHGVLVALHLEDLAHEYRLTDLVVDQDVDVAQVCVRRDVLFTLEGVLKHPQSQFDVLNVQLNTSRELCVLAGRLKLNN